MELYNLPFDLSLPVNYIFNAIDDLIELADQASMPMTNDQAVNLAYMIFARQPILLQDLRAWHKKPAAEKTWPNMKVHLREAQDDLSSLPVAGSMHPNPQQANFSTITEMVTQRILQEQANLANHQVQDIYELHPANFPPPASSVATPTTATEDVTPVSNQSVLTYQFSAMANIMQQREQDLQTHEQQMLT